MAALFASGHLGNPNASAFAWLNTFLAGVWFGVAYWKTGDLWFPFGMHLAWNWMQGAFFGIEVSGLTEITASPLLKEIDRGPSLEKEIRRPLHVRSCDKQNPILN